jgi:DNA-binding MarR family transcriptional regulator
MPDKAASTLSLLFDLFAASQRVRSLLATAMEGCGLTPEEYAVYSAVLELEPISPTDLAATVGMPPTTVSHYIRAMRERRHLAESPHPGDGRSRVLHLTRSGRVAHRRANRAFEEAYGRFVAQLADTAAARTTLAEIERAAEQALRDLREDTTARAG